MRIEDIQAMPSWPAAMPVKLAARYLGCSRSMFYKLYYEKLKELKTPDGRYRRTDLDKALQADAGQYTT